MRFFILLSGLALVHLGCSSGSSRRAADAGATTGTSETQGTGGEVVTTDDSGGSGEDGTQPDDTAANEDAATTGDDTSVPDEGTTGVDTSVPDEGTTGVDTSVPDEGTTGVDTSLPDTGGDDVVVGATCEEMVGDCLPALPVSPAEACMLVNAPECMDLLIAEYEVSGCGPDCNGLTLPNLDAVCNDSACATMLATLQGIGIITSQCQGCGPCMPECGAAVCGNDGCGGSCGTCGVGEACQDGACVAVPTTCEDVVGACMPTLPLPPETTCSVVDEPECFDLLIASYDASGCGADCDGLTIPNLDALCNDPTCGNVLAAMQDFGLITTQCQDCTGCTPDCGTAVCGDDGCGGSCGTCPDGETCNNGACEMVDPGNSCVGACGGAAPGGTCYCDDACAGYGDCCPDACAACGIDCP